MTSPGLRLDARPDVVYVPDTELFTTNFSFGASSYFWDFGDNGTSTDFSNPLTSIRLKARYDIMLIASDDHGDGAICSDTLVRMVVARQGGSTKVPNAFTPNQNGPSGEFRLTAPSTIYSYLS